MLGVRKILPDHFICTCFDALSVVFELGENYKKNCTSVNFNSYTVIQLSFVDQDILRVLRISLNLIIGQYFENTLWL